MLDGFGTVVDALGEFAISPQYILCGLELVYYLGRSNYRQKRTWLLKGKCGGRDKLGASGIPFLVPVGLKMSDRWPLRSWQLGWADTLRLVLPQRFNSQASDHCTADKLPSISVSVQFHIVERAPP